MYLESWVVSGCEGRRNFRTDADSEHMGEAGRLEMDKNLNSQSDEINRDFSTKLASIA